VFYLLNFCRVEAHLKNYFETTLNSTDEPLSTANLKESLNRFDAILTTVTDKLGPELFDGVRSDSTKTRIIGNYGVGFSHIDLDGAERLGIAVTNTPDVLSECTADVAILLMLMVARRAGEGERELRGGQWTGWRPTHMIGSKVSGGTLGIVGFGRIGKEVAKRACGFGMNVQVYNRSKIDQEILNQFDAVQMSSLAELASSSDFVSLHCPGGEENTHLIDAQFLTMMKSEAYLINTARGEVIDESALIDAVKSGVIAGAGLDVFCDEPNINPALYEVKNVVLLPHLGSASKTTRDAMGFRVIDNLNAFFDGKEPLDRVG